MTNRVEAVFDASIKQHSEPNIRELMMEEIDDNCNAPYMRHGYDSLL